VKRAILALTVLLSLFLAACGGTSTSSTSRLTDRVFASNTYSNTVHIIDATADTLSSYTVGSGTAPTFLAIPPGTKPIAKTLIYNSGGPSVTVTTNSTESTAGTISLPSAVTSMVVQNTSVGIVAMPGLLCSGSLGAVAFLDIASQYDTVALVCVPSARTLVLSNSGDTVMVFNNSSNAVTLIDTTSYALRTVTLAAPAFDHPVWAAFSSDDSTAYVLNCGPQCGGTTAGVQAINVSAGTAAGTLLILSAADTGLLSGSTFYVAGTTAGASGAGVLSVVNVSSTTPTLSSSVAIGDGYHTLMAVGSNNKLFIGAKQCTDNPNSSTPSGCLSMYDTSAKTVVIDSARDLLYCDPAPASCTHAKGDVTGIAAVTGRSVMYVVEGSILRIFSTSSSSETGQISTGGAVYGVVAVDK
jgi:hypothetical protein